MSSPLAKGLQAAAKKSEPVAQQEAPRRARKAPSPANAPAVPATVMIGAHFSPGVKSALRMVQASPQNVGKTSRELLGEAINDLCAKYGVPEPFTAE